jgi:hypothetical protein
MFPIVPTTVCGFAPLPPEQDQEPGAVWFDLEMARQFDHRGHWVDHHDHPVGIWRVDLPRLIVHPREVESVISQALEDRYPDMDAYDLLTGSGGSGENPPEFVVERCRDLLSPRYCAALLDVVISNYYVRALVPLERGLCRLESRRTS